MNQPLKPGSLLLSLETSCDETSAAVLRDGHQVLSNVISSQIETHRRFGGVVPEIASRKHIANVLTVVDEALREAGISKEQLDAVAVTHGPGLVGALLVGVSLAKSLAYGLGIPLIPVHHLAGHMYANTLGEEELTFPLVCLIVSGGHTSLVHWEGHTRRTLLGQTRDDAAGEAFDKIARVLGFGYPGGPAIEKAAAGGNPRAIEYPRAWLEKGSLDFSFSGLKSAVINDLHNRSQKGEEPRPEDVAASFQAALVEVLAEKTRLAALQTGVHTVALAGGVAANRALQQGLRERLSPEGIRLLVPPPVLCTDNAAMIGAAGYYAWQAGVTGDATLNAYPGLELY